MIKNTNRYEAAIANLTSLEARYDDAVATGSSRKDEIRELLRAAQSEARAAYNAAN